MYALTDFSYGEANDEFYRDMSKLLRSVNLAHIVAVANAINAQVGQIAETQWHIRGTFPTDTNRGSSGDRLIPVCSDHMLFLECNLLS